MHVAVVMETDRIVDRLSQEEKFNLLQSLLNDLHRAGVLSARSLMAVASDVMHLDYHEDGDLLTFSDFQHDNEEE